MAQLDEKSNLGLRCPRADVVRVVDALLLVSAALTLLWWMASIRMSRHATFRRVYEDVSQRRDRTCLGSQLMRGSARVIVPQVHSLNSFPQNLHTNGSRVLDFWKGLLSRG